MNFVSRAGGFNDDGVALLKLHEHEINGSLASTLSAFHELDVTIEILPYPGLRTRSDIVKFFCLLAGVIVAKTRISRSS